MHFGHLFLVCWEDWYVLPLGVGWGDAYDSYLLEELKILFIRRIPLVYKRHAKKVKEDKRAGRNENIRRQMATEWRKNEEGRLGYQ